LKLGCACSFIVMIDTWCIPLIINSYLNFKTYSITFINCPNRVVWQKLEKMWESWKRFKASWMGHGAWMGIAWGNMENGRMGPKHSSWNVTCFGGDMFRGFKLPKHWNTRWVAHLNLTCFGGWLVSRFMFCGT